MRPNKRIAAAGEPNVLDPEFRLAVACCRWCFSGSSSDEVQRLLHRVDGPGFIRLVRRHRVHGFAAKALHAHGFSLATDLGRLLAADAAALAANNLLAASTSFTLRGAFEKEGVPLLFLKGLTLSTLVYGDPYLKMSSDIDVLIDKKHLTQAAGLLAGFGFRLATPSSEEALIRWHARAKESVWTKGRLVLDLHTRLADSPSLIPTIGIASEKQLVQLVNLGSLPTLNTHDLFAYLCIHGASSAWFRLKWIADLAALLHKIGRTAELYRHAIAQGAGRAPGQALLLAETLKLIDLPPGLRGEIARDHITHALFRAALRELLDIREPTERLFGTARLHFTQLFLAGGARFVLSETKRRIREIGHRRLGLGTGPPLRRRARHSLWRWLQSRA